MHDHYDHNQTLVPESFLALHSRHDRPLRSRAEIEARHELCEDVALHAAAFLAQRHQEGDDTGEALKRCHDGLRADPDAFAAAEAAWVVRRVAELQDWPQPDWLAELERRHRRRSIGHRVKAPQRLRSLLEEGLIDAVVRQLMSGKEATVYVVRCGEDTRCAKVYKEATQRSFRQAVDYTENRKVKNTRQARAMAKGTRFGRQAQEAAWQSAEVDALYRLAAAGVRVPKPINFHDGVLLMELVVDAEGAAAPRLNDVAFTAEEARAHHATLIAEVVRMLCAGVIHGDLSEFNILLAADGPVIIDLPQAVDAAGNNHAQRMLLRDVDNLRAFFGRFAPDLLATQFGAEIWALYTRGVLQPATPLTGRHEAQRGPVDVASVLRVVGDARDEEEARLLRMRSAGG